MPSPDYILKKVQTNVLNNILTNITISKYATAYYKKADIINNAKPHLNKKYILKMDITNFFDNITYQIIKKLVFKSVYYPSLVQNILTNLCCLEETLPQGAPTSPAISNIIMRYFDDYIGNLCNRKDISYTRFCDDLILSGDFDYKEVIRKISSFLHTMGFKVNKTKTKVIYQNKKQIVTGIVVNEKINVSKEYRKKLRQKIYFCKKYGVYNHTSKINVNSKSYLESLLGKINFILHVNPNDIYFKEAKKDIINLKNTI